MRRRVALPFAALLLASALAVPLPASAHAILVASTPADGSTLKGGHVPLRLRFNSRIDAVRSRIALRGPDGREHVLHLAVNKVGDQLSGSAELHPGAYLLRWQVLAVDGHITRGEVRFAVAPGP